jgi:hypothetical protein
VRLDPARELMMDRAQRQVAFELFEGLFDFGELQVTFPQLGGVGLGEVGAQEVPAFAAPRGAQRFAVEPSTQGGRLGLACSV